MRLQRWFGFARLVAAICAAATVVSAPAFAAGELVSAYVLLGPDGAPVARALTTAAVCPRLRVDGRARRMTMRAGAETIPQRPTRSGAQDSKPSTFAELTCEAAVPHGARRASIAGQPLPLPPRQIRRLIVFGDTGCRVKRSDNAFQDCTDLAQYPFALIAAAAAKWKPDLVVHVGDYLYRENACDDAHPKCANSPWGYGSDAWRADFFTPADPLLRAAPWAVVRGNHESCNRAGQGWWRFMDPRPLVAGQDCNDPAHDDVGDYSDPYGIPLGEGVQLIVYDSSNTPSSPIPADDVRAARYRDTYEKIEALTRRADHNILADHHPVLGFSARQLKGGDIHLDGGNAGLQSVFGAQSPTFFPPKTDFLLSGHIHLWETVSFSSPHPAQFIAGFGGTQEDIVPLPAAAPPGATPAPGAVVQAMSSWIDGFGFMTMERVSPDHWMVQIRDVQGAVVNTCEIKGSKANCAMAQVRVAKPAP
jgi:Calcineurin-like phosphoesterase